MASICELDKKDRKIIEYIKLIYKDVYMNLDRNPLKIFICGSSNRKNTKSIRDLVTLKLKVNKYLKIFYPEELFMEIINTDKDIDLLELEKYIAENSDIICIICEGEGALVELGAFVNDKVLKDKMVVVVDKKRRKDRSFMIIGPIKSIEKKDKKNVIYYDEHRNCEDIIDKLEKNFKKKYKEKNHNRKQKIDSLMGLYYFIPLLLYFFFDIDISKLQKYLSLAFEFKDMDNKKFNTIYKISLKLLYKDKYIKKNIEGDKKNYTLTKQGYEFIKEILGMKKNIEENKKYDKIRLDILFFKLYR